MSPSHAYAEIEDPFWTPPIRPCIAYVGGNMYLGSRMVRNLPFLKALKITHVLAISLVRSPMPFGDHAGSLDRATDEGIKVYTMKADDEEGDRLLPLYEEEEVKAFLQEGTSGDNKCVVHCLAGSSRSPTMIALRLIDRGLSVLEALLLLLSARLDLEPRFSFIEDMKRLEKKLGMKESYEAANLPGELREDGNIDLLESIEKKRTFLMKHIDLVKKLKEREPEPQETGLELYKKFRFDGLDSEPL